MQVHLDTDFAGDTDPDGLRAEYAHSFLDGPAFADTWLAAVERADSHN